MVGEKDKCDIHLFHVFIKFMWLCSNEKNICKCIKFQEWKQHLDFGFTTTGEYWEVIDIEVFTCINIELDFFSSHMSFLQGKHGKYTSSLLDA